MKGKRLKLPLRSLYNGSIMILPYDYTKHKRLVLMRTVAESAGKEVWIESKINV